MKEDYLFKLCENLLKPRRIIIAWGKDADKIHELLESCKARRLR